ncbi:M20 family metallopeptidase [Terrarubrum flagellatum]|uniref:M20 family metallopeptidase n=1 Tax=Terrirubrum flagellatum TaxID=2895980 RepID=UPI003144F7C0
MALNESESAVTAWLATQKQAMIDLVADLVNADSGSYDKTGVDKAGEVLTGFFKKQGFEIEIVPSAEYGDAIKATLPHPASNDQRPIVLMGHRDTVFPVGEPRRRPFQIVEGHGRGPGVADMKAGLVLNAFVAAAMARIENRPGPIMLLVTSDEEIASPSSRPVIEQVARDARCVFNSEPSRTPEMGQRFTQGRKQMITQGRKGGVFMRFEVTGKAAHSGAAYERGISAILDLSKKVPLLHELTDLKEGITVNVGLIGGGQTVNTVAPSAWGEIDLRYVRTEQRDRLVARIKEIVETPMVAGASGKFIIKGEFLPLEQSAEARSMLEVYQGAAAEFGFEVGAQFSGGCADSGFTAAQGCPTLCSVGPIGGAGHTPDEFLEIDSLVPCAQALALAVMRVSERLPKREA